MDNFNLKKYLAEGSIHEIFGFGATKMQEGDLFRLNTDRGSFLFRFSGQGEAMYMEDKNEEINMVTFAKGRTRVDKIKEGMVLNIMGLKVSGGDNVTVNDIIYKNKPVKSISLRRS